LELKFRRKEIESNIAKKTYIGIVLDESGSMSSCATQAISGVNEQIQTIKKTAEGHEEDTYITFVKFSDNPDTLLANKPISVLKEIDKAKYRPKGSTALYDAVASAIDTMRDSADPRDDNAFLLVIVSDGEENNSHKYNAESIASRIKDLQSTGKWTITYMGQIQDLSQAKKMGIAERNISIFVNTASGMDEATRTINKSYGNYLKSRYSADAGANFSMNDFYDDDKVVDKN
jgi:Mg-chelatase subunit ChlD